MPPIKDQAIVLRRLDYSETSQVLAFMTRGHGPRRLIAKGIRRGTKKRFAPGIDLLERGTLQFTPPTGGDGLGKVTEWKQTEGYLGLREKLDRLYAAQYAAEATTTMTEDGDPHPRLFDALDYLLKELRRADATKPLLAEYQCVLLREVGLWPELGRCVISDRPAPPNRPAYFSAIQGGLVSRQVLNQAPEHKLVSAAALDALRTRQIDSAVADEIFELLDYALSHTLGRPLKTSRFVQASTPPGTDQ